MLEWIVLFVLIVVEVAAFWWWLRKEYYPVFFNGWAALIYTSILALDFIIAWLVSMIQTPGGSTATAWLVAFGIFLVVIVFLGTLFFRWVVRTEITDIPK